MVLFFVPCAILSDATQSNGVPLADYQTFAVTTATALVIVVSVQVSEATVVFICNYLFVPSACINHAPLLFFSRVSVCDVDRAGHGLLDSNQPCVCVGLSGLLLHHHVGSAQSDPLQDLSQSVPLCRSVRPLFFCICLSHTHKH